MKKLLKTLFKMIFWSLILLLLIPPVYFAWRAAQPMELPEFNGLTYYQYFEWRKVSYDNAIAEYRQTHPEKEIKNPHACMQANFLGENTFGWYTAGIILFAQGNPEITRGWDEFSLAAIPDKRVTILNFLPELWRAHEYVLWGTNPTIRQSPVPYCRIHETIPGPEELEAIKREQEDIAAIP
jgi:hypothetical protein